MTHRPVVVHVVPPPTGVANRLAPEYNPAPGTTLPEKVDLYFNTGSKNLNTESDARLNAIASAMTANRDARVNVNGYTDNVGNPASNVQLSQGRADTVKADLVNKGVSADRISAKGLGEENPIADNATMRGRALNRRVTVVVEGR
jgi:outer membrane protein OmpA-like peptidoglycan-associated protein